MNIVVYVVLSIHNVPHTWASTMSCTDYVFQHDTLSIIKPPWPNGCTSDPSGNGPMFNSRMRILFLLCSLPCVRIVLFLLFTSPALLLLVLVLLILLLPYLLFLRLFFSLFSCSYYQYSYVLLPPTPIPTPTPSPTPSPKKPHYKNIS